MTDRRDGRFFPNHQEIIIAAPTRIYHVFTKNGDEPVSRLVKAQNPSQALAHVARTDYAVEKPTQDDLVDLASNGVKVEAAIEEPAA